VVVECVPADVAGPPSPRRLKIPTIGIGAGPNCDGQILVTPDVLGMFEELKPRFAKRYADVGGEIRAGGHRRTAGRCARGAFPGAEQSFR